jgi:hypothetical protein
MSSPAENQPAFAHTGEGELENSTESPLLPTAIGWYPDEHDPGSVRYFDGTSWTNQTHSYVTVDDTGLVSVPASIVTGEWLPKACPRHGLPMGHTVSGVVFLSRPALWSYFTLPLGLGIWVLIMWLSCKRVTSRPWVACDSCVRVSKERKLLSTSLVGASVALFVLALFMPDSVGWYVAGASVACLIATLAVVLAKPFAYSRIQGGTTSMDGETVLFKRPSREFRATASPAALAGQA